MPRLLDLPRGGLPPRRRRSWWGPRKRSLKGSLKLRFPRESVCYVGRRGIKRGTTHRFNRVLEAGIVKLRGYVLLPCL